MQANFFRSPQIRKFLGTHSAIATAELCKQTFLKFANPQILSLIPLSQIRKFLSIASPQIPNPQIFMKKSRIRKFSQNFALLSQNSPKGRLLEQFFIFFYFELQHSMLYFKEKKNRVHVCAGLWKL